MLTPILSYSYFLNVHPILPVINKIEFLKQYRDETETYPSGELLNAMFGAAARFVECEYLERDRLKTSPNDAVWDIPMGWSDHFFNQAEGKNYESVYISNKCIWANHICHVMK